MTFTFELNEPHNDLSFVQRINIQLLHCVKHVVYIHKNGPTKQIFNAVLNVCWLGGGFCLGYIHHWSSLATYYARDGPQQFKVDF